MIVREHINFQRGLDPKESMGVGLLSEIQKWYKSVTNFPYANKHAALITAAAYGKIKYIKFLLDIGADINITYPTSLGKTALFYAIANEEHKAAKYLLKRGADTKNIFDHGGDAEIALLKYMKELKIPIPIKEHNFQRGLDPKEAMSIGMTDKRIMQNAEKILKDAFPYLDIRFKEDMNSKHSYYALMSGNPDLFIDLQLLYNSKKSVHEPGFCLYDNDGGELFVPDKPLYEIQPIISALHEYIAKYGWWQDEKKYINDEYIV